MLIFDKLKAKLFTFNEETKSSDANTNKLAAEYFDHSYQELVKDCDRVFAILLGAQWIFAVGLAIFISPTTWIGTQGLVHAHIWASIIIGGILSLGPIYLYFKQPGATVNRYVNVIAQGLYSFLLIHLTGGRIETHFHVFGSLAFFAFYRDVKVLLVGTAAVAIDHLVRGIWFPLSVFGIAGESPFRWIEHAAWVLFEDFFLIYSCVRSLHEMKVVALKRAETEIAKLGVEDVVKVRTKELVLEKANMQLILNNIDQALFTVRRNGQINPQHSHACSHIFNKEIGGLSIKEVLTDGKTDWLEILELIFSEAIPVEGLLETLPQKLVIDKRTLNLTYKVVRQNEVIDHLLVIATDISLMLELEDLRKKEHERYASIIKVMSGKNEFIECCEILADFTSCPDLVSAKRALHTLKGSFSFFELRWIANCCHHWEQKLIDSNPSQLNEILKEAHREIAMMTDQFLSENKHLLKLEKDKKSVEILLSTIEGALKLIRNSGVHTPEVEAAFDQMLGVEIGDELRWLNDVYEQAANMLGKEVNPIVFTSDTKIPTQIYSELFKSFIHIVRNSVDHGLEDPADREMMGKSRAGNLKVHLHSKGEFWHLSFKDDGSGVNLSKLKAKYSERNQNIPSSDEELVQYIFKSGTSTKDEVTTISGRGIGLDAVRAEALRHGGDVKAVNHPGEGLEIQVWFRRRSFAEHVQETQFDKAGSF